MDAPPDDVGGRDNSESGDVAGRDNSESGDVAGRDNSGSGDVAGRDNFEIFVRTRTPALLRAAFLLTGDQHLAEDLVQEALARTHRMWGRLRDPANVEAYTRKIMYHTQVSLWRRRRVAESFPGNLPDQAHDPADHASSTTQRVALERALSVLSARQRAVIVLRYFEDRTEAETAEILGMALGTVKTQASRALERLRKFAPELLALPTTDGVGR